MYGEHRLSNPLVGLERHRQLSEISGTYESVVDKDEARMVLLVGDPGEGKTRLIREFYELLATRQSDPKYWPPSFLPDYGSAEDRELRFRKLVAPAGDFEWASKALPDWLWWGINCGRATTWEELGAVGQHASSLRRHFPAALLRWLDLAPLSTRVRRRVQALLLDDAGNAVAGDSLGIVLQKLAGEGLISHLPLAGILYNLVRRSAEASKEYHHLRNLLEDDVTLDPPHRLLSKVGVEMASELRSLALPGLPIIIAIEDAHLADEGTCAMLSSILRPDRSSDAPILVLATATSEGLAANGCTFAETLLWLEHDYRRVDRLSLVSLDRADLAKLVSAELRPHIISSGRFATPLAVEVLRDLWDNSSLIARQRFITDDRTGAGVVEQLFTERWRALSIGQQRALLVAAGSTHRGLGIGSQTEFLPILVEHASVVQQPLLDSLPEAWISRSETGLCGFREELLAETVFRALDAANPSPFLLSPETSRSAAVDLASTASSLAARTHAAQVAVGLTERLGLPVDQSIVETAARLSKTEMRLFRYADAVATGRLALEWNLALGADRLTVADELDLRRTVGLSLHFGGRPTEAAREIRSALRLARRTNQPVVERNQCCLDLAWLALEDGELADADRYLSSFEPTAESTTVEREQVLMFRNLLGLLIGRKGDLDAACAQLENVVDGALRLLSAGDPQIIVYRSNLATLRGRSGSASEAVRVLDTVLADYREAGIGLDNPITYVVQINRCVWLAGSGELDTAEGELERLIERVASTIGSRTSEWHTANLHLSSIRASRLRPIALGELLRLQWSSCSSLGRAHIISLNFRFSVCETLVRMGRLRRAARNLGRLINDSNSVGASLIAMKATVLLATTLLNRGRLSDAIVQLEGLPPATPRYSNAPELQFVRAGVRHVTDRAMEWAVSALESTWGAGGGLLLKVPMWGHVLMALGVRVPAVPAFLNGPTSPATVQALFRSIQPAGVPPSVLDILDARRAVRTPTEPEADAAASLKVSMTMAAADLARRAGNAADALSHYRQVVVMLSDDLPSLHPRLLAAKRDLASALADAGELDAAVGLYRQTWTEQVDVCGERHPDTLLTKHNEALTIGENGDYQLAVSNLESLGPYMFWTFGWSKELANWAATLADCLYRLPDPTRSLSHLQDVAEAASCVGHYGEDVRRRCEVASYRTIAHFCQQVDEFCARVVRVQATCVEPDGREMAQLVRLNEVRTLLGLPPGPAADAGTRPGVAAEDEGERTQILLSALRQLAAKSVGDPSEPSRGPTGDTPLVRVALATHDGDADAARRALAETTLADLDSRLAYLAWDRGLVFVLADLEERAQQLSRLSQASAPLDLSLLVARQAYETLTADLADLFASRLAQAQTNLDPSNPIPAAVGWRCLEGLLVCGAEHASGLASRWAELVCDRYGWTDLRALEIAVLASQVSSGSARLDLIREVLMRRCEAGSVSSALDAAVALKSELEVEIDRTLDELGVVLEGYDDDDALRRSAHRLGGLVGEWSTLVGLELELRASGVCDPLQLHATVAMAACFLLERELASQLPGLFASVRKRVASWPTDGGLMKTLDDLAEAAIRDS